MNMDNEDPNYVSPNTRYHNQGHTFNCDHCGTEGRQWHDTQRFCRTPATCMNDWYKVHGKTKPRLL